MKISNEEAYDMLTVYFECHQKSIIASRIYAMRYPERRHYTKRTFTRFTRLRENGDIRLPIINRRSGIGRCERDIINVLTYIGIYPHIKIQQISLDLGIAKSTVHNILKNNRLHPYHMVLHQALMETDYDNRLDYCHWFINMTRENPQFVSNILWTDKATFSSVGSVNLHNMHYWAPTNPHWMQEVQYQGRWSINVWCGII